MDSSLTHGCRWQVSAYPADDLREDRDKALQDDSSLDLLGLE
jgi:hypothetical protein